MFTKINNSIAFPLIALVGILAAALVVIGAMGLRGMTQSKNGLESVYKDRVVPLRDLKIIADLYAVNIVDTNHKVRDGIISWSQARKNLEEADTTIQQKWKEYTATYLVEEEKRLVAEIEPMFKDTAVALNRLKDILAREDQAAAAEFAAGSLYPAIDPISEKFSQLIEIQLDVAKREYELTAASYAATRIANIVIIALGLLLGIGLAWWIIRSITESLARLQDTIVRVEQSGDCTLRAGLSDQNEIGRTAAAFDSMMVRFAGLIGNTRQSADAIATAAESMSAAGIQVAHGSGAQSEAASAVAAAIEETSVSISETAGNANSADQIATRTRINIENTLINVRSTADEVENLAGMIHEASEDIARLAESSRQIDGIVQTIKDIADQTNLLALNAAIEAARAGEQGRGFAVVADEVRKLAENTAKSTNEISGLIGGIQSQVDGAVKRMQIANDKAGVTRDRVITSTDALDAVNADTGQVSASVRSIADAVREQDAAVQQVAQRMEQISQMTEENTAAAGTAAETARHLDNLAAKLRDAVSRFIGTTEKSDYLGC